MTTRAEYDAVIRTDFYSFARKVFNELNPSTLFKDNWHLELLAHRLDQVRLGKTRRLIINVPPRSLKSLITSIALPAFILGHDPGARLLCVSHSNDLVTTFGRQSRQVLESDWYRRAFPNTVLSKSAEDLLETTRGGFRKAASIEAGITGHGGMYILIDDPLAANDVTSKVSREKVIRLYRESLYTRLDDKIEGRIVLVMQRLHEKDLAGFLIEQRTFEALVLPAIAIEDEKYILGNGSVHLRRAGSLLHPTHEPQAALDEARGMLSASGYAAQYQQAPVPEEGQQIKAEWIRRYERKPDRDGARVTILWDTAIKGTVSADYSVATVWLKRDETHYLLDVYRKRVDLPQLVEHAAELHQRYRADFNLIEGQGSGASLIAYLKAKHGIHSIEVRPRDDKITRFERAGFYFERGQVAFPNDALWLADLETEMFRFPNAPNDDQVDSVSQYINWSHDRGNSFLIVHSLRDDAVQTAGSVADMLVQRNAYPWL